MKTIGVLTSGGDAPGMNAAVRSIVRSAEAMGIKVKGVMRGYNGLIENHFVDLDIRSVSDIIQCGGTVLYTARCPKFKIEEGIQEAIKNCEIVNYDIFEALNMPKTFDEETYLLANMISS